MGKLQKPHPHPPSSLFDIHQDGQRDIAAESRRPSPFLDGPSRASLAPASTALMNSRLNVALLHRDSKPLPSVPPPTGSGLRASQTASVAVPRRRSTIRAVPSFEDRNRRSTDDDTASDASPSPATLSASTFSTFVDPNAGAASPPVHSLHNGASRPAGQRRVSQGMAAPPAALSREYGQASVMDIPLRDSSLGASSRPAATKPASVAMDSVYDAERHREDGQVGSTVVAAEAHASHGWDSTVGKAGLGKTGRVINRLVSDNEALKRDLRIERLKADESRQAARLLEDKMERMVSDYESRLLEASVTKTLLSRKERQVESLQATLDLERKRAVEARDKERTWREEVEKVRSEAKRQVEEATGLAALMEGRYNAISSHWRDQGEEVRKVMAGMSKEIRELVEDRQRDDDRITLLRDLCDQQDGNIRDLRQQKKDISRQFDDYRDEQERALRDIKLGAAEREADQGRTLAEAREVLDKLRWALNIKNEVDWAG